MLLLNIKKENDDLGKQVNNCNRFLLKKHIKHTLLLLFILLSLASYSQNLDYNKGKTYIIGSITVKGNTAFNEQTIIAYSGLRKGKEIAVPGEDISNAIKKLWGSKFFSDIEIYIAEVKGTVAHLQIRLSDLPELNDVKVTGVKKSKIEAVVKDNKLEKGTKVTENLITTTKNFLVKKYKKQGFYNTKVNINTIEVKDDSIPKSRVNMVVAVDKGEKVKIKNITFNGNKALSDKDLRKAMKSTKQIKRTRILKRSKFIDSAYHTDKQLAQKLRIRKGDTYNGELLEKRIADASRPDGDDITNLYQNNGYLFSTITPVEVSAANNVIDMEIRINEGKAARFNTVTVVGNDKTNDHVVYREIRTRPGQLYSKANVVRTVRELGQLGFFDAQEIVPNFNNANPNEGTIDMEYSVKETGSSQIELQGGFGGGGFIGTLGLSFNNFSIKNLFNKEAYRPVPTGDGQKLALRLQASRFNQTYSFSFTEPWLGGKKPVQFSASVSHTRQFSFDNQSRSADRNRSFNITGLTLGLAKRLTVPDDFFTLSQSLSYQVYDLKDFETSLFSFGNGNAKNLSYKVGLSRNNTNVDPIFPTGGSNFSVTAKASIPYSLFSNTDYAALREEESKL